MSGFKRCGLPSAQDDVELKAQRPLCLRYSQVEVGDQALSGARIWNGLKDGIKGKERVTRKVHLCDQARSKGISKKRKMNVGRTPCILMVLPGIGARFDGNEAIAPTLISKGAAGAGKVRIQRRRMVIAIVAVAAGGIGLPNFNQCVRNWATIIIQDADRKSVV